MVNGHVHFGTPNTHEKRSVPYPQFLDEAIKELCEGREADAILFGNGTAVMTLDTYADLFEDDLDDVSLCLDEMRTETVVGLL